MSDLDATEPDTHENDETPDPEQARLALADDQYQRIARRIRSGRHDHVIHDLLRVIADDVLLADGIAAATGLQPEAVDRALHDLEEAGIVEAIDLGTHTGWTLRRYNRWDPDAIMAAGDLLDNLVDHKTIAERVGIRRLSMHQARRRHRDDPVTAMPEPVARFGNSTPVFWWADVETWLRRLGYRIEDPDARPDYPTPTGPPDAN